MSKRGRTSSVTGRQDDDGESSDAPLSEPSKKKKRMDPNDYCSYLYEVIRNYKKDDGSLLCDTLIRVPKRRQDPTYYDVVSNPIDLLKIQQKIKTEEYEDVEDMATDVELMVNNAKSFYKKNTQEYKDAVELWELFNSTKTKLLDSDDQSSVDSDKKGKIILKVGKLARKAAAAAEAKRQDMDDTTSEGSSVMEEEVNQIEELFTAVMQATDENNRPLSTPFTLLPSKKRYPEYYDVIDNPIDLKLIAKRIQANQYNNINDLEKDLFLMTKNACTFNTPGSPIYKDAKTLKKVIISRKFDIVHGKNKQKQGRPKRPRNSQTLSAITAAMKDEDTSENEEEVEGDSDVDLDNPRWQLFEVVKNTTNNGGYALCEPFMKLPSKRYYPDYYHEIKNPVSLLQIKNKLRKGDYGTVSEVAGDLNIMFENAKKYNRPDSRLYKDAIKLQKVMQHKVKELLDFDQDSDSDSDSDNSPIVKRDSPVVKKRGRKSAAFIRGKYKDNPSLRKRLLSICKVLMDYTYEDGRQPILMFMEKPSKKLYPEYYKVIPEPIDLLQIQSNIKAEKYQNEEQFVNDLKLMFENCRKFNEENSVIYKDANNLEKVLNDKLKELGPLHEGATPKKPSMKTYKPRRKLNPTDAKLKQLYETIKECRDAKGRQLSLVFTKLPSKTDYPDYYEVIKKPMDMDKIGSKLKLGQYENLDDLVADLILMLDNACKFNEPDSQIYKDALQLQRLVLQTKLQLREDENSVPDVQAAVQELLTSLFSSVYTHQDEEGRCFSDCMQELPEHDDVDGKKVRGISLDIVKRRLDKGLYKRLDRFQEDLFACLERARRLSRTDSQVFEDSIELQAFYIRQRDELCRQGDVLNSPALNYNLLHLSAAVEQQKQQKLLKETPSEEENEARNIEENAANGTANSTPTPTPSGDAMVFNQQQYHVGDFVYIQPRDRNADPSIIHILRGWTNAEGVQMLYGDCFYRPNETYHLQTRKFLEKEVFKSDQHIAVPLSQVLGRCCVMSIRDYLKYKPEGFDEKDVYVCESRYSSKARMFKKIKAWPFSIDRLTLIPREETFEPKRIMSVFKDRLEKHITEIQELEEYEKLEEKEKPNIQLMNMPPNPDISAYFQQYNLPWGAIKTGDFVYVENENSPRLVAQVDTIWQNKEGEVYIKGPWFLRPSEILFIPGRTFYKQEMILGSLEEIHPVSTVVGRCCIMEHSEYISCRPTEIEEKDVFICTSIYNEQRRQLSKLVNGLKRYTHSDTVTQDEIYFFRRLINPVKVTSESIALHTIQDSRNIQQTQTITYDNSDSNLLNPKIEQEILSLMEDSLDGGPPSVGSGDIPPQSPLPISTPLTGTKKKPKDKNSTKLVSGYILYSSEIRKGICAAHPSANFGEISRMVGNEWRQLPSEEKQIWEEKAAKMNEEMKEAKALEDALHPPGSISTIIPNPPNLPSNYTFECLWDNCDYQFEDLHDCLDHAVTEQTGHVQMYFAAVPPAECEWLCQWKGCIRIKKGCPPFPSLSRLARHVKEVHIMKSNGRVIQPNDRSKNYTPSKRPPSQKPQQVQIPQGQFYSVAQANEKPPEPIFVTVPPRPHRLLHSDVYIKYIEGLSAENRYISNWDRMLKATQENTPTVPESRLPGHWLGNGTGNYGSITTALWALRDYMLRDALNISKVL